MTLHEFLNAVKNGDKIRFKTWVLSSDFIYFDTRLKKWFDEDGTEYGFNAFHWGKLDDFELYKEPELTQEDVKKKYNFRLIPSCHTCKRYLTCNMYKEREINGCRLLINDVICDAWESAK